MKTKCDSDREPASVGRIMFATCAYFRSFRSHLPSPPNSIISNDLPFLPGKKKKGNFQGVFGHGQKEVEEPEGSAPQ